MARIPRHYWFKAQAEVEFARLKDCYLVTDAAIADKCEAWSAHADEECQKLGDDAEVEAYLNEHAHIYDALSEHYPVVSPSLWEMALRRPVESRVA